MNISIKLEDIGVNENNVQMKRRLLLLRENVLNITGSIIGDIHHWYQFGSQSEGTGGQNSDSDYLHSDEAFIVLQDISERDRKPGVNNLLVFQDELTPPGYCMLQIPDSTHQFLLRTAPELLTSEFTKRYAGKLMMKNSLKNLRKLDKMDEHGPAFINQSKTVDLVYVLPFKTLPDSVSNWLKQQLQKGWLTPDMKRYIESHPCYAVPVGCKGSPNEDLQWRISTSHAERCVMFNLNITQIQCYVLLKMMLQKHLKHPSEQGLSSFMCKNVLLLCIEDSDLDDWRPGNLLSLVKLCLLQLEHCLSEEYCPHFIMHENNLMAGKFKPEVKLWLLDKIHKLYQARDIHLLRLTTDEVDFSESIFYTQLPNLAYIVNFAHRELLYAIKFRNTSFDTIIKKIIEFYRQGDSLEQAAILLLTPLIYSSLGSVLASSDIEQGQLVSDEALVWLSMGLDSDVTSGRLKLASVYYCTGDYSKAEAILRFTEDNYDTRMVQAICMCTLEASKYDFSTGLKNYIHGKDEQAIRHSLAYCVRFIQSEIHCVPKELQYEMFRSKKEDSKLAEYNIKSFAIKKLPGMPKKMILDMHISENRTLMNCSMDWAVVDSLPYLHFLQYKTYGYLQRRADQIQALKKFVSSINTAGVIEHNETTLNLLGQCCEQENRRDLAFRCYKSSLEIRSRNNAASIHICRLLNSLISAL